MSPRLVVNVDGGARGNPGPAAIAAVVSTPEGEVIEERSEVIGEATNNVAEYRALLLGIERASELGADSLFYLPLEAVARCIGLDAGQLCRACLTTEYPTETGAQLYQLALLDRNGKDKGRTYERVRPVPVKSGS